MFAQPISPTMGDSSRRWVQAIAAKPEASVLETHTVQGEKQLRLVIL